MLVQNTLTRTCRLQEEIVADMKDSIKDMPAEKVQRSIRPHVEDVKKYMAERDALQSSLDAHFELACLLNKELERAKADLADMRGVCLAAIRMPPR